MNKVNDKNYDVAILTCAPKDYFVTSLERLKSQNIKPTKIVVCNTDEKLFFSRISDKNKLQNLLKECNVELININKKDFDHGATRNLCAKYLKSSHLLFMTDDAVPYDDKLSENLLSSFNDDKVAVAYARQIPREDSKLKEKYTREFNYPDYDIVKELSKEKEYGIKNYFCSNVCAMYDKKIFDEMNGFEENIILNEDTFYVYKVINNGYKVKYCSKAKVIHSHDYTYKEQYRRNYEIGISQEEKSEIFDNINSVGEGRKLLKYVLSRLISKWHIIMAFDFMIECLYRYKGYKDGRKAVKNIKR